MVLKKTLFLLLFSNVAFSTILSNPEEEEEEEELVIVDSVGVEGEEGEEEVADRDRDIPSLYDRNRMDLMRKRDKRLRKEGKCYPPPDVIVSPYIYSPTPGSQVTQPR